jgi:two-component system, OmpR family, phosphate regulon response regulator PhoB
VITILIVEDEPAIRELLAIQLKSADYKVVLAPDAIQARARLLEGAPDLFLLDWMLPGESGLDLARSIRRDASVRNVPIIMITARAQEGDRILGFDAGIDDYITKPFSAREVIARVKAVLRRSKPETDETTLTIGPLRLDPTSKRVFVRLPNDEDQELELTSNEFRLLRHFMRFPETAMSRERLLNAVWSGESLVDERTVDAQIRRLRNALKAGAMEHCIETVRGEGYRLKYLP